MGRTFRHAGPDRERLRCVHGYLLRRCAPDASTGGDFGESSGSISDRRDDSNSQTEKEKGRSISQMSATAPKQDNHLYPNSRWLQKKCPYRLPQRKRKRQSPTGALPQCHQVKNQRPNRTGASCGRAGGSRRACRKETSIEKTAATCCATGGGEHFGARSGVALGGTIHGNHRAVA